MSLFDQDKLLRLIDEDLKVCRDAASKLSPGDKPGRDRNALEFSTLMAHLNWTRQAGTDQDELGRIVDSLQGNEFLRGYERWREQCEIKSCPEHGEPMRFPTSWLP